MVLHPSGAMEKEIHTLSLKFFSVKIHYNRYHSGALKSKL